MTDRIDPGPGWRLLGRRERIVAGDQYRFNRGWRATSRDGCMPGTMTYRRRIASPSTTKSIATRATVRSVFAGGIATESTIRSDVGLSLSQMEKATEAYEKRLFDLRNKSAMPEYIMLEIQRGENDF